MGSKPIAIVINGKEYQSLSEASFFTGINVNRLSHMYKRLEASNRREIDQKLQFYRNFTFSRPKKNDNE